MSNRIMAGVLAASVALTSIGSAPAAAKDAGEVGRILLGAGALLIIGSSIARGGNNGHVTRHVPPPVVVHPPRRVVPAACLRHNQFAEGPRKYFGQHCLRKNMAHANRLPGACLRRVWTPRGERNVFSARCLRKSGWVFG